MSNSILKPVGIVALTIGTIALASAAWARYQRKSDEKEIINDQIAANSFNEFSGADGKGNRVGFRDGIPYVNRSI